LDVPTTAIEDQLRDLPLHTMIRLQPMRRHTDLSAWELICKTC
jgi:hypothetical protein